MLNIHPENGAHHPIIMFSWNSTHYAITIIPFKSLTCHRGRAEEGQIKCKKNYRDNRISDIWEINVSWYGDGEKSGKEWGKWRQIKYISNGPWHSKIHFRGLLWPINKWGFFLTHPAKTCFVLVFCYLLAARHVQIFHTRCVTWLASKDRSKSWKSHGSCKCWRSTKQVNVLRAENFEVKLP